MKMIIDTYEPKEWLMMPRVKGGNPNGFLYDWLDGQEEFSFIDEFGRQLVAKDLGNGQVEVQTK